MASETATSPSNDNMPASAEAGEGADRPLLDMSDAVQTMVGRARQRGFVTHGEINAVLSSEEVTSERIEDILAMLHEMGISTVEQDESESDPAGAGEAAPKACWRTQALKLDAPFAFHSGTVVSLPSLRRTSTSA